MMTPEDVKKLALELGEMNASAITANRFSPQFSWHDEEGTPRAFLMTTFPGDDEEDEDDTADRITLGVSMITSCMRDCGALTFMADAYISSHDGPTIDEVLRGVADGSIAPDHRREALNMVVALSDGSLVTVLVPYNRPAEGSIVLLPDEVHMGVQDPDNEPVVHGFMPDLCMRSMSMPKVLDEMQTAEPFATLLKTIGLDKERSDLHVLCLAVKMVMASTGFMVGLHPRSDLESEVFERSLKHGPLSEDLTVLMPDQVEEVQALEKLYDL